MYTITILPTGSSSHGQVTQSNAQREWESDDAPSSGAPAPLAGVGTGSQWLPQDRGFGRPGASHVRHVRREPAAVPRSEWPFVLRAATRASVSGWSSSTPPQGFNLLDQPVSPVVGSLL
ncbi:hypothetical protein Lfu02_75740 [Longispora fulva]|uniref:Uncharacterized protein n=1 Tax=Longispora fulva TaxID=619741 RepID=A0A8J7GP39_9ACTN|nr:hypothetical protein [Longispora fulva]GIG63202.1 hypothetical protein Lfu02_75740 [Longispora fulva]